MRQVDLSGNVVTSFPQKAVPSAGRDPEASGTLHQRDSVAVSGEQTEVEAPVQKKWTVLMYEAGDNDLAGWIRQDVMEAESIGSSGQMNIAAQLDLGGAACNRYHLEKSDNDNAITSPVLQSLGSVNMSDPACLADFVTWGMKNFPADNYMLIISDHGAGWKGAVQDATSRGWMTPGEIKEGLSLAEKETGRKIDVLGFDACLMANTEVAYELKDRAEFLVASEEVEGANGWPYVRLLTAESIKKLQRALREKLDINPADFATKVVECASADQNNLPTLSAMSLKAMENVAKAADNLAEKIMTTTDSHRRIRKLFGEAENFSSYKDAQHVAKLLAGSKDLKDEELKKAATGFLQSLQGAVLAEHSAKYPGATGLTIEAPTHWTSPSEQYMALDFARDTGWDEMLKKIDSWWPF